MSYKIQLSPCALITKKRFSTSLSIGTTSEQLLTLFTAALIDVTKITYNNVEDFYGNHLNCLHGASPTCQSGLHT